MCVCVGVGGGGGGGVCVVDQWFDLGLLFMMICLGTQSLGINDFESTCADFGFWM